MMRGGNTDSTVVVADAPILAPPVVSRAWSAIAMHDDYWPAVEAKLRPGGLVLVNDTTFTGEVRTDVVVHRVPATTVATDLGSPLSGSMVMLGAFVTTTREMILGQERRLGASLDWGRLRYTMDDGSAAAVRVAFKTLYDRDLAYRTEALVNWCPGCGTSVSDLEVISTPETGTLWSIRYHLIDEASGEPDPDRTITVATTRPETILGDTAVAVHPDDDRYRDVVSRQVRIPFVERNVPVIADAASLHRNTSG